MANGTVPQLTKKRRVGRQLRDLGAIFNPRVAPIVQSQIMQERAAEQEELNGRLAGINLAVDFVMRNPNLVEPEVRQNVFNEARNAGIQIPEGFALTDSQPSASSVLDQPTTKLGKLQLRRRQFQDAIANTTDQAQIERLNRGLDEVDRAIELSTTRSDRGINVTTSPDGGTSISIGGKANLPLTKTQINKQQEKLINTQDSISNLNEIQRSFDDSFLNLFERGKIGMLNFADKLGLGISDSNKADITKFTNFKSGVLDNINSEIKRISGAQVSDKEAERLRQSMPDVNDGPTQFKANFNRTIRLLRLSAARAAYMLNNGIEVNEKGFQRIPLSNVEDLMVETEEELRNQYLQQSPDASEEEINALIERDLKKIFGIL